MWLRMLTEQDGTLFLVVRVFTQDREGADGETKRGRDRER